MAPLPLAGPLNVRGRHRPGAHASRGGG